MPLVGFSECADEGTAVIIMNIEFFRYFLNLTAAVGVQFPLRVPGTASGRERWRSWLW